MRITRFFCHLTGHWTSLINCPCWVSTSLEMSIFHGEIRPITKLGFLFTYKVFFTSLQLPFSTRPKSAPATNMDYICGSIFLPPSETSYQANRRPNHYWLPWLAIEKVSAFSEKRIIKGNLLKARNYLFSHECIFCLTVNKVPVFS